MTNPSRIINYDSPPAQYKLYALIESYIILSKGIIFRVYLRCITGYDIIRNIVYREGMYFQIKHAICMGNAIQFWIIFGPMKYIYYSFKHC